MGIEIERKFLITDGNVCREYGDTVDSIIQGYLVVGPVSIRVRRTYTAYDMYTVMTIKGPGTIERPEFEYSIPHAHFALLLDLCGTKIIRKNRYQIEYGTKTWVVDNFASPLDGLVLAEIELERVDEEFERPLWLGKEVTDDVRYANAYLAEHGAWWK